MSSYNRRSVEILDTYYQQPLQNTFDLPDTCIESMCFDLAKCYPSCLMDNKHGFPLYSIQDSVTVYNGFNELSFVHYYIDRVEIKRFYQDTDWREHRHTTNVLLKRACRILDKQRMHQEERH